MRKLEEQKCKIGIFGGSFNPIHLGHLHIAQKALEKFELSKIIFIPTYKNPIKKRSHFLSDAQRIELIELAIKNNPLFELSRFEINRQQPSYTIKTIEQIHRQLKSHTEQEIETYFITGADSFSTIECWFDYKKLLERTNFIVFNRPKGPDLESLTLIVERLGFWYNSSNAEAKNTSARTFHSTAGSSINLIETNALEISSTDIREALNTDRQITELVSHEIELKLKEFIKEKH